MLIQTLGGFGVLELKNIIKIAGEARVINDMSLDIASKQVFGMIFTNGKGKSELADIISGVDTEYEGKIIIRGEEYCSADPEKKLLALRRRVGYVPAEIPFYKDMTVYEVMDFVGSAKKIASEMKYRQIKEALDLTGTDNVKDMLISKLTLDACRRVALAAALLGNPDLLILDEPFSALDPTARDNMNTLISMIGKLKCVIVVTHSADNMEPLCDSIAIVADGKVLLTDTVESIRKKINSTKTMLARIVPKNKENQPDLKEFLVGVEGVSNCVVRSITEAGEINIKIEYETDREIEEVLLNKLSEKGYIILSSENITLGLSDVCLALSRKQDGGEI